MKHRQHSLAALRNRAGAIDEARKMPWPVENQLKAATDPTIPAIQRGDRAAPAIPFPEPLLIVKAIANPCRYSCAA